MVEKERKIAIIKEGLPESIQESCQKIKGVELLSTTEVRQKTEKKKSQ